MKSLPQLISLSPTVSPCLAGFLVVIHLLAMLSIFISNLPVWLISLLLLAILFSGYIQWRKLILRNLATAIVKAEWLPDNRWRMVDGVGSSQLVEHWTILLNQPKLIMLKFHLLNKKSTILPIFPDAVEAELRRQLRVRLNTTRPPETQGQAVG